MSSASGAVPAGPTGSAGHPPLDEPAADRPGRPAAFEQPAPIPEPVVTPAPAPSPERTRSGTVWVSVVVGAVVLIALIDFVAQNGRQVSVHFLGWSGRTSQAVALLIAAVGAALIVAIPASVRMVQLRRQIRRHGL